MEDIVIDSKLDFKTYFRISLLMFFRIRSLIFLFLYFLLIQYFTFEYSPFDWGTELMIIAIFIAFYCGLIPVIIYFACKANMKKSAVLNEKLIYYINSDKIEIKGETISASKNWQYIPKLVERENYFLMMLSARTFHYLPKNGFVSPEDTARLKNIAREKGVKIKYN